MSRTLKYFSLALLLTLFLALVGSRAEAQNTVVDVELVLAVDSSGSVNFSEFDLQLRGIAAAFRSPEVKQAIREGPYHRIAVTLMEWASFDLQQISLNWMLINSDQAAEDFAEHVDRAPRMIETGATSISAAMIFGAGLFEGNGFTGTRQVIDISGDGFNNQGPTLEGPRDAIVEQGVIINALAIENQVIELGDYFEMHVIGGYGSFVERAEDYKDYVRAIKRKLLKEIRGQPLS